jgi:hypothetical protein
MNQELQDKLIKKYPEQFKNIKWIEIEDGWYDLLDRLCHLIKNELDHKARINEPLKDFGWQQIKEKFGGLRAYVFGGNDRIDGAISMAESMSYSICEYTGEKGKSRKQKKDEVTGQIIPAWIKTLSDKEAERQGYIL